MRSDDDVKDARNVLRTIAEGDLRWKQERDDGPRRPRSGSGPFVPADFNTRCIPAPAPAPPATAVSGASAFTG